MPSLWSKLAGLNLLVQEHRRVELPPVRGGGEEHRRQAVHLAGAGEEGLGEDISVFLGDVPPVDLAGHWTLASFCAHLRALELWAEPPEWEMARRWRTWALQSAALDLALRQAGLALHDVLGRAPRPLTYVNSLGLGEPPSTDTILRRLEHYPGLRFKLDAAPDWTPEIVDVLAGTGAVHTIDFKGQYGLETDATALPALYDRVLDAFPDALLEDPHDLPWVAERLAAHLDRVAYDAPIATLADLDATPLPARTFNVKPSRVGDLETLFDLYAACEDRGLAMYGGGMGENDVARGQVQLLAAIFSPDAPNDVAPPGFNAPEPAAGMPASPLDPAPAPTGFRREP